MGSVGIIAEYNPFHNGHLYHLQKVKEMFPNDTIILVMSGNFTQRGEVSLIDKWKKTEIAIKAGVDLVIELPFAFATQSADYFSYGAITLLELLNVEKFVFGSESDNINDLKTIAANQLYNDEFDKLVRIYSKLGKNYPTALSLALKDLTGITINDPNDLLGISYLKTIEKYKYKIKPISIKRSSNNYHSTNIDNTICSATAIRTNLKEKKDISKNIPEFVNDYLYDIHFIDDYYDYLKYKILTSKDLTKYQLVDDRIAKNLKKEIFDSQNYDELIKNIKLKNYTYSKISRCLLHILCNYTKEEANSMKDIRYIRLLGFNDKGRAYLNKNKKNIQIPIISKISKEKDSMLELEIKTTKIYSLTAKCPNEEIKKEYQNNLYYK